MPELRALLTDAGFEDVRTYVAERQRRAVLGCAAE